MNHRRTVRSSPPRPGAPALGLALAFALAGCQTAGPELSGIAELPPLDYSVLVTGGAFLRPSPGTGTATFAPGFEADSEPLPIEELLAVLRAGAVFHRVAADPDEEHRRAIQRAFAAGGVSPDLQRYLQRARDEGFDLLLVVEQVQDGEIEAQGINARWPVTLATWLLLGVGMFIPDHTFESRATLRVTLRDLQTGRVVHDPLLPAVLVDLSMVERTDFLGVVSSIVVPPFWVHDDVESVQRGVRETTVRRLLLSLVRDLKSEPVRVRLRERAIAAITLEDRVLAIDAAENVAAVRLRPAGAPLPPAAAERFERTLLESLRGEGGRYRLRAELPRELGPGPVQVLVGTITGNVTSGTFVLGGGRP